MNEFQYAFRYQVSSPTILAIDEKGNWTMLKEGEMTLILYGRSQYNGSPEFEAEVDKRGIKRQIDTTGTTEIPFHIQHKLSITSTRLQPVYRLYHPELQVHFYTSDKNEHAVCRKQRLKTRRNGLPFKRYHSCLQTLLKNISIHEMRMKKCPCPSRLDS